MESEYAYNTDIEMVMDFMRLAILFKNQNLNESDLANIIDLEQALIELLPVAQSNRMSTVYNNLTIIHKKHKKMFENRHKSNIAIASHHQKINYNPLEKALDKRDDHFIVLFYNSLCSSCMKIMDDWTKFKQLHTRSNFTILDYNNRDPNNSSIFNRFKITHVPTIIKLRLDSQDYMEIMQGPININTLGDFAYF
jgi:thiol-disulfide isomerase/thioredoxin